MIRRSLASCVATLLFLFLVGAAYAHDYWFRPEKLALSKGDRLKVRLMVGDALDPEEERPLQKGKTTRFDLITSNGTVDLLAAGEEGASPILDREVDFEGMALLSMDRGFSFIELDDEEFSEYLKHEGLEEIEKIRDRIGHREMEREKYARSLKSLVRVGDAQESNLHKRVLGQKIEILLLQDPYRLDPGDDLEVKVLFDGKPLSDKAVTAYNGDGKDPISKSVARTNDLGVARFRLDEKGFWLIRLVHLMVCEGCPDADWVSHWASFSFQLD